VQHVTNVSKAPKDNFFIPNHVNAEYNAHYLVTGVYGTIYLCESKTGRLKNLAIKRFNALFDPEHVKRLPRNGIRGIRFAHSTSNSHRFSLMNFQMMISELLRALKYLDSAQVIHRDLKPDNLAISESGKLTLLDFGFSRVKAQADMTQGPGTGYYRAIETIAFDMNNDRRVYNEKADIWSIGAILCEMITGKILFKAVPPRSDNQLSTAISICGPVPGNVIDASRYVSF
ncbi:hypothetical protein PMAYCL1PPCAC_27243, partial [Pristionchus mayeri]